MFEPALTGLVQFFLLQLLAAVGFSCDSVTASMQKGKQQA